MKSLTGFWRVFSLLILAPNGLKAFVVKIEPELGIRRH